MNMPLQTHTEHLRERAYIEALEADLAAAETDLARVIIELRVAHGDVVTLRAELDYVADRYREAVEAMHRAHDWKWLCPIAALAATTIMVLAIGWLTQ